MTELTLDPWETQRRPHCWPANTPCPNHCAQAHADHVLRNHVPLYGPWAGWRFAGRDLVSPNGTRVSQRRMQGLVWRVEAEERLQQVKARNHARRNNVFTLRTP